MLQQRGIPKENVLFRILKNKSTSMSSICDKLNHNVGNIILLSEDELCELWQHIKGILLEAENLYTHANVTGKYAKECTLMVKLIHKISVLALETIKQQIFIPNVLLQTIMLLHSVALPNVKDDPVKNEISYVLELWWKLDMTWKERVIKNALKYLIQNCKCSMKHVKRLYEIRSAITVLKCTDDVQELLKLVRETIVMSLEEGRMLILHLFTLEEQYILGIYNNVRVVLQKIEDNHIASYADLYSKAWFKATKKFKKFIIENCLQNIIFHCFRANRDSTGRGQLGKNLLSFLAAMHDTTKHERARLMIHNECKRLLWEHLKAPGSYIRCNAVEILFMTSSVQYTCTAKYTNKMYLQKFYKIISDLLNDTDSEVCLVTMKGLFGLLGTYWNCIPNDTIRDWLNIFLNHTTDANNSKIRENVFTGIQNILVNDRAHKILRDFLPNFAKSIYDDDKYVLKALIKLLLHAHFQVAMPFWDIVPINYIVDRIKTTEDTYLLTKLIKLVWIRLSSNNMQYDEIHDKMRRVGLSNINAVRRLCLHSKPIINWNTSRKLIEATIPMIKKEMKCLSLTKRTCNKKPRLRDVDDEYDDCTNLCHEDFDSYRNVHIYIDVIATLLVANEKTITEEQFFEGEMNILQEIAHILPNFFEYFRHTSVNDSVLFLFSLIPAQFFLNKIDVIEMLVQELCDTDTSDDTLLTVIYVFMRWRKGDTIFFTLTNLFIKSINMDEQHDKDIIDNVEITQINQKSLELSLRIWRHVLLVEPQSALIIKYHSDILKFWKLLDKLKTFLESEVRNECNLDNLICKDTIVQFFKEYMYMIWLLNKNDVFDATERFSELIFWIKRTMLPHISCLDLNEIEQHSTCIRLIEAALDMSNLQLTECNTPKLCCNVVILYCSCLYTTSGIIFLGKAFNAILILLDFGKMAYEQNERNLLRIVIPNLICVTMVGLTRYNKDTLMKYANGLKMLCTLTQKYFAVVKNTHEEESLGLQYIRIMLNTALSSISADMTRLLQCPSPTEEQILMNKLPYLARRVLGVILNVKKYQKLCIQVLLNTITSYTNIDMLSALLIIHKIIKASDKTAVNRLKNVTLATKLHNQKQNCDTPFERSVTGAINVVIDAIIHY